MGLVFTISITAIFVSVVFPLGIIVTLKKKPKKRIHSFPNFILPNFSFSPSPDILPFPTLLTRRFSEFRGKQHRMMLKSSVSEGAQPE